MQIIDHLIENQVRHMSYTKCRVLIV